MNGNADTQPVSVNSGGYGGLVGPCGGIVASAVTKFDADGKVLWSRQNIPRALPVDLSMNTRGQVMLAPAGVRTNAHVALIDGGGLVPAPGGEDSTGDATGVAGAEAAEPCASAVGIASPGQTVALVFDGSDRLVMQTREPAQVIVSEYDRAPADIVIPLNVPSVKDTGHDLFHEKMRSGLACASCHPEGTKTATSGSSKASGSAARNRWLGASAPPRRFIGATPFRPGARVKWPLPKRSSAVESCSTTSRWGVPIVTAGR